MVQSLYNVNHNCFLFLENKITDFSYFVSVINKEMHVDICVENIKKEMFTYRISVHSFTK